MFVSVTRLRVRSAIYLPAFVWETFLSQWQVLRATGFRGGRLLIDARLTFWTLTLWENDRAMKVFRGSGAHAKVMPRLAKWCDEASYAHWASEIDSVPEWQDAYEHLVKDGRLSRVERPSPTHEARRFKEPRLKPLIGADLKPSGKLV
ncbi:MAG: DUF3291 domain-containing protein [Candidatus Sulfotelmatobacter sp.]